jgi:hypothetical protein
MNDVWLVWNDWAEEYDSPMSSDLIEVFADRKKAMAWLDEYVTSHDGKWSNNHSVFYSTSVGMVLDKFYVASHALKE